MADPLLDIETLIVRPEAEIDGKRYEILSPDELSVLDAQRFALWAKKLHELQGTGEESPELDELVATIARKVAVGVPDDLFAKLTGQHRIAVVEVFTGLLLRRRAGVAGAVRTAMGSPSTGASSFPGSSGSTAGAPAPGWRRFLRRLSAPLRR